jgi:hypothetical protein
MTFDFEIRVVNEIEGVSLTEENCKLENLEELEDDKKSSSYWITFDYMGLEMRTESKNWITDFQVDKETNRGKTDFNYKLRRAFEPTTDFRDYLRSEIWLNLWESTPTFNESKNDEDIIIKEAIIKDGAPVFDKKLLYVSLVHSP